MKAPAPAVRARSATNAAAEPAATPSAIAGARTPLSRELWGTPANDQGWTENRPGIVREINSWLQNEHSRTSDTLDALLLPRPNELVPWTDHAPKVSNAVSNQRMRRAKILLAARNLIIAHGRDGFTLNDIADASDVTVPTIYNLVGRRSDVIVSCFEEFLRLVIATGLSDQDPMLNPVASLSAVAVPVTLRAPKFAREIIQAMRDENPGLRQSLERHSVFGTREALRRMRACGKLHAWVDIPLLASHISAQNAATSVGWANGEIADESLWPMHLYKVGLLLLGCVTEQHAQGMRLMVQEAQELCRLTH